MKYKFKTSEFFDDIGKTSKAISRSVTYGLCFLGLEYVNEKFLGSSMHVFKKDTPLFSSEVAFAFTQCLLLIGTAFEAIDFSYNAIRTPGKFLTGQYFKKKSVEEKVEDSD